MKEIPENRLGVKEILYKQLGLLAKDSEKCSGEELCSNSHAMVEITNVLLMIGN